MRVEERWGGGSGTVTESVELDPSLVKSLPHLAGIGDRCGGLSAQFGPTRATIGLDSPKRVRKWLGVGKIGLGIDQVRRRS